MPGEGKDNSEKNNRRYNRQDITMQDNNGLGKEKTMVKRIIGGGNKQDATIQDNNGLFKEKTMVRRTIGCNNLGQQWDFANCCIQESDGTGQTIMIQAKDKSIIQELQEQQLSIKCFSRFCFIIKILKTSLILDK